MQLKIHNQVHQEACWKEAAYTGESIPAERRIQPEAPGRSLPVSTSGSGTAWTMAPCLQAVQEAICAPEASWEEAACTGESGPAEQRIQSRGLWEEPSTLHLWTENSLGHCAQSPHSAGGQLCTRRPPRKRQLALVSPALTTSPTNTSEK